MSVTDVKCAYCGKRTPPERQASPPWTWPGKGLVTNCISCAGVCPKCLNNLDEDGYCTEPGCVNEGKSPSPEAPSEPAQPVVIVVRDPDCENMITCYGCEPLVVDVDLGYLDLGDDEEWAEWLEARQAELATVTNPEAREHIEAVLNETAEGHEHELPFAVKS